jgi:hypothetical protein
VASFSKTRSKLNRAICAYLISVGAGSKDDTTPANSPGPSSYPRTTVRATMSIPEVHMTGLRRVRVHISVKGSAALKPEEPNPDLARAQFDERLGAVYDALMQTAATDGQTLSWTAQAITAAGQAMATAVDNSDAAALFARNNADMADFTCHAWYDAGEGDGEADAEGCDWEEILMFDALVSPSAIS